MKKGLAGTLLIVLVLPSSGIAGGWGYGPRPRYHRITPPYAKPYKVYQYRDNGAAIAAGVLGGIVTGVILDRLLTPPMERRAPQPSCCPGPPVHDPPAQGYGDPYDQGFQQGYRQGVERGRIERYRRGHQQGYDQGVDDAASGRIWASTNP